MLYWLRFSFALCAWKLVFVWAATLCHWMETVRWPWWKNVNIKGKVSKVNPNTCMFQRASGRVWCWLALCCVISSLVICACCCAVVLPRGEGDDYPSHTHVYTLPAATSWCHSPEWRATAVSCTRGLLANARTKLNVGFGFFMLIFANAHAQTDVTVFRTTKVTVTQSLLFFCKAAFLVNGMRERVVFAQHYLRCQHFSSETHCGNAVLLGFWTC